VFYLRIGHLKFFLYYLPPLSTLYICTKSENFGAGTFIQHGFATVITAERIGENCWINQQVTIGFNDSRKYGYGKPTIGNNVRVSAGAKVCGKIKVGDGSTIGVNAVVVKDVPEKSVVVPSPMMLIMENGNSVYKKF
jgi:serine O-acetyltransferase